MSPAKIQTAPVASSSLEEILSVPAGYWTFKCAIAGHEQLFLANEVLHCTLSSPNQTVHLLRGNVEIRRADFARGDLDNLA